MSEPAREDAPPPGAGPLEEGCERLCAVALVGMMALIGAEAFTRNLLGFSLQISDEIGGYLLVAVAFLSLSVAQAHGAYHQVELVQARLSPRGRLVTGLLFDAVSLLASAILLWQLVRHELSTWRSGDVAPTLLLTPLWIPEIVMPIGAAILCLTLIRTIAGKARRLGGVATRGRKR
jgi:TRAP-type C4-dicarboxylate transport system permease small subunit